jgi:hypothetical protein
VRALTQEDLIDVGCSTPNCTHDHSVLFLHSFCHPEMALGACYEKATGELVLFCALCDEPVTRFRVASK